MKMRRRQEREARRVFGFLSMSFWEHVIFEKSPPPEVSKRPAVLRERWRLQGQNAPQKISVSSEISWLPNALSYLPRQLLSRSKIDDREKPNPIK